MAFSNGISIGSHNTIARSDSLHPAQLTCREENILRPIRGNLKLRKLHGILLTYNKNRMASNRQCFGINSRQLHQLPHPVIYDLNHEIVKA